MGVGPRPVGLGLGSPALVVSPRAVVVCALAPSAALVADPSGWSPFGPAKWLAIGLVVWIGAALALVDRDRVGTPRGPTVAWRAFLSAVALAAVLGLDGRYAWIGTPERHFGVVAWLVCFMAFVAGRSLATEADSRFVGGGAAATAGLIGSWSVAEALGFAPIDVGGGTDRLGGPFGSPAYLGAATVLLVPMALAFAADRDQPLRYRGTAACCATLGLVALVGSGTRGAWVGAVVAGVVALWASRSWVGTLSTRRVLSATAALAISLGLVMALTPAGGRIAELFDGTGGAGRASAEAGAGRGGGVSRVDEWRVALRVAGEHPLVGVGPEGYRIAFADGVDAVYERAHGRSVLPDRAHNGLLDITVTTGMLGLTAYLALIGIVGRFVVRALRTGPGWVFGTAVGLVGYLAQQQFLFPLAELDPLAWMLTGLVVAQTGGPQTGGARTGGPQSSENVTGGAQTGGAASAIESAPAGEAAGQAGIAAAAVLPRSDPPTVNGGAGPGVEGVVQTTVWSAARPPIKIVAAIACAALATATAVLGVREVLADRAARRSVDAGAAGNRQTAIDEAERAVDLRADALRYRLVAAEAWSATQTVPALRRALAHVDAALDTSPRDPIVLDRRAELLLQMAQLTSAPTDRTAALAAYADLVDHDPLHAERQLRYGIAATEAGEPETAEAAWLAAEDLAPRSAAASVNLARLYLADGRLIEARAAAERALAREPESETARAAFVAVIEASVVEATSAVRSAAEIDGT